MDALAEDLQELSSHENRGQLQARGRGGGAGAVGRGLGRGLNTLSTWRPAASRAMMCWDRMGTAALHSVRKT